MVLYLRCEEWELGKPEFERVSLVWHWYKKRSHSRGVVHSTHFHSNNNYEMTNELVKQGKASQGGKFERN